MSTTLEAPQAPHLDLPTWRLNVLRGGYLFMAIGLMIVKWPLLPDAHTLPLYEAVTLCLLTAMSFLALLGVRHPIKMLPILVFETLWKLLWFAVVALPRAASDNLDSGTSEILIKNLFVVVIIAAVPWGYVWRSYVRAPGDRWR